MANLLMIDDSPHSQKYLERIIRHRTPHSIEFAGDVQKGIEKIVAQRPDLIFLDLFLPGTDGFELFVTLRNHPATHNVPIIIHTAVPLDDITLLRLRRMTHDGLVEFPIEASEINRLINIALKRNSSRTQKWTPPNA